MSKRDRATSEERAIFDKKTQEILEQKAAVNNEKYKVKPITQGHKDLLETIDECQFIICSGPAGTGKTHLSIGKAIEYLKADKVKKVLLVRPIQECGRNLGAMPGDKDEKIKPHMLAFTELFSKFLNAAQLEKYVREEKIVIDTCEYMRGRTFDDTFIVVDEAQNCSYTQLKMLITRVGNNSKFVVVGDATQTDLPYWQKFLDEYNGNTLRVPLDVMMDRLDDRDDDIAIIELSEKDIVRNKKLSDIIKWMG